MPVAFVPPTTTVARPPTELLERATRRRIVVRVMIARPWPGTAGPPPKATAGRPCSLFAERCAAVVFVVHKLCAK